MRGRVTWHVCELGASISVDSGRIQSPNVDALLSLKTVILDRRKSQESNSRIDDR